MFLKGGLAASVAPLISLTTCVAQDPTAEGSTRQPHEKLALALNDFITANYNQSLIKQRTILRRGISQENLYEFEKKFNELEQRFAEEPLGKKKQRLEACLEEHGLSAGIANKLEQWLAGSPVQNDPTKELAEFFEKHGLLFRNPINGLVRGYELIRAAPPEKITITLFGKEHNIAIRKINDDLISHPVRYNAEQLPMLSTISSAYNPKTKLIEWRVHDALKFANGMYESYDKNRKRIADDIKKPDFLDQFLESGNDLGSFAPIDSGKRMGTEFIAHLSAQLHHAALKDLYTASKTRQDFTTKLAARFDKDILFHEGMHAVDLVELDGIQGLMSFLDKVVEKEKEKTRPKPTEKELVALKNELIIIGYRDLEIRGYLSSMYHGQSALTLAQIVGGIRPPVNIYCAAYQTIIRNICNYMVNHKKDWPQFEISADTAAHDILKKFPRLMLEKKLTEDDLKRLAHSVFQDMYAGRTLNEHIEWWMQK
jgi:hypothetical protein